MRAGAIRSVVLLDLRSITRDHVALATAALSLMGTLAVAGIGLAQGRPPAWSDWFPLVVAMGLVEGPPAFAFLFASLMVEEGETGVREALAVTPLRLRDVLLTRTVIATGWMCAWPLVSVHIMNGTWHALDLTPVEWLLVIVPLALLTPGLVLLIPTLARDRVSALAVLKALSFVALIPLVLFLVPAGSGYRMLFLLSPTGWSVEAYLDLVAGDGGAAWWAMGAVGYAAALLLIALRHLEAKVYGSPDRTPVRAR